MWGIDPSYRMTGKDWDNLSERWPNWYWIKHGATVDLRYEKDYRSSKMPPLFDTLRLTIRSADTTSGWIYGSTKGDWKTYEQSEMVRMLAARKESKRQREPLAPRFPKPTKIRDSRRTAS